MFFGFLLLYQAIAGGYPHDPAGVPLSFICAYRTLAAEYAKMLRPDYDADIIFDALMLGSLCNKTRPINFPLSSSQPDLEVNNNVIYVAVDGNDQNPGTLKEPKKTVGAGLTATRKLSPPKSLLIGPGTYYLPSPLELGSRDSGLTISSSKKSGEVWLSGAQPLPTSLKWTKYNVSSSNFTLDVLPNQNNQHGCNANDPKAVGCGCYNGSSFGWTLDNCIALCKKLGPKSCKSFAWSSNATSSMWKDKCCIHNDNVWTPSTQTEHTSGKWQGYVRNIWKTTIKEGIEIEQLRVNQKRGIRARHPNADPETDLYPVGYNLKAEQWLPKKPPPGKPTFVNVYNAAISERGSGSFKNYSGGIGGPCHVFDPPFSYWCSEHPAGGGGFQYFVPSGLVWPEGSFPTKKWSAKGKNAVAHVWRRSHWSNWMFEIDSVDEAKSTLHFGKGGFQGCRGGNGSDWYLENVLELLDVPNEFFWDSESRELYYYPNGTIGIPPSSNLNATAPKLQTLIFANASQLAPIKNLIIDGIGFRDSSPTYLEPHGVPSGGDWALERRAALFFEGTEGLIIRNSKFERLDGNGIMLSGYHRYATLFKNEFAYTGGSAMAGWGRTDEITDNGIHGYDATSGDFPRYTMVDSNVIRETGIWEKQSSCWFQAKTAQTTLKNNICFNLARAGFNFNDGLGGGDQVYNNLIFNSCRESADHGPINSWDRQPFVTTVATGKPSARMIPRNITRNFLVGNYGGGNGPIDNDDGSLFYDNNHNFEVYGHQKFKIGAIRSFNNVMAYAHEFGGHWPAPGTASGHPNEMFGNTVIYNPSSSQMYHNCDPWNAHDNKLYGSKVHIEGSNCKKKYTLDEWQKIGKNHDKGSTWQKNLPSDEEIINAARSVLGMEISLST